MTAAALDTVAIDGEPAVVPVADALYGFVDVEIKEGLVALLSLYGEVRANVGTTVERVVTGLSWAASFSRALKGADFKQYPLTTRGGTGGRLSWTYSDGRELARVVVHGPGVFRWGAFRTAAPPAGVTHALARVRGIMLPSSLAADELARLLVVWRGGV